MTQRDISREDLKEVMNDASHNALERAREQNIGITYLKGKTIVVEYPDGSGNTIEELEGKLVEIETQTYSLSS
jgi:hypothetical protein